MEFELDLIEQIVADEQAALGCFTACVGVLAGAALGWVGASGLTRAGEVLFATTTIVSAIFSAWFFVQWRKARSRRPTLLRELRARARPR